MRIFGFLPLVCMLALQASAQKPSQMSLADTTALDKPVLFDPMVSARGTTLVIPSSFDPDIVFREQLFLIPQLNSGGQPPLLEKPTLTAIDMMIPWRLQMERERKLRPLQTFLATVQIGGVAYLAYEHLRKKGVFK